MIPFDSKRGRMARSEAGHQEVRRQEGKTKQLLQEILNYIHPFWLPCNDPQALFLASRRIIHQGLLYRQEEAEGSIDDPLGHLPDVKLFSTRFSGIQIGSWRLPAQTNPILYEGVVTSESRVVVEPEAVAARGEFSGILKIVSTFKGPGGVWKIEGTAFVVGTFYALTAGHMMWHQKLGPAYSAVLYADARSGTHAQSIECVAVAVHAEWMKFHQPENDFCMVAVAQGFNQGVRRLQFGRPPCSGVGKVVGFPLDLPATSPGNELIECQGPVLTHPTKAGVMLTHKVNTSGGSSGSPLYVEGKVVAVHIRFDRNEKQNYAAPINQNGNNVTQFEDVLRHVANQQVKLSDRTSFLGEIPHGKDREQSVFAFGSQAASGC